MSILAGLLDLLRSWGEVLRQHLPTIGAWFAGRASAERDQLARQAERAAEQVRIGAEPTPSPDRILEDMQNGRF